MRVAQNRDESKRVAETLKINKYAHMCKQIDFEDCVC